jgi:hypothetical protein
LRYCVLSIGIERLGNSQIQDEQSQHGGKQAIAQSEQPQGPFFVSQVHFSFLVVFHALFHSPCRALTSLEGLNDFTPAGTPFLPATQSLIYAEFRMNGLYVEIFHIATIKNYT